MNSLSPDTLIDSFLFDHAESEPDRVLLTDRTGQYDYAGIAAGIEAISAALHSLGVRKGHVVSWQLPNWHEACLIHHGAIRLGAISNPILPIHRARELTHILNQTGSKVLFAPQEFRGFDHEEMASRLVHDVPALDRVILVRAKLPTPLVRLEDLLSAHRGDTAPMPKRSAEDPAVLLYTSGTTALAKGVVHDHRALVYENGTFIDEFGLDRDDVIFMPSPVAHVTGILIGLQLPPMIGGEVVFDDVWDAARGLETIDRHGCTFMVGATPFLQGLIERCEATGRRGTSLKAYACGGADVSPDLIERAERSLTGYATRIYGLTEVPTVTMTGPTEPASKRAFTDGRLIGGAEMRVVDDAGRALPPGGIGELRLRGPEMFVGYLTDDGEIDRIGEDEWFPTGDLASVDEHGYLTIRGRKKDIILRGGENISVKEVEDLLFGHPAVREVAIVAMPDPLLGERACAFVVSEGPEGPTLEQLCSFLDEHRIARQKLPERLEPIDRLPKNAAGKVQKFKLREMIEERLKR